MNITHEILDVLSKEASPLCMDGLVGTLTPPPNNAIVWNNRVSQSIRTLLELEFITRSNSLTNTFYELAPRGNGWLWHKRLRDGEAADGVRRI